MHEQNGAPGKAEGERFAETVAIAHPPTLLMVLVHGWFSQALLRVEERMSSSNGSKTKAALERRVNELLELFYPVHYKIGFAFEDGMRLGQLTRNQAAILWLIHYEGIERRCMRRKDIERSLKTWFEVSSSGITKALRGMSRPSLALLKILEDPDSAREKQVILTSKG
jgi:hypothetical protein